MKRSSSKRKASAKENDRRASEKASKNNKAKLLKRFNVKQVGKGETLRCARLKVWAATCLRGSVAVSAASS